MLDILDLILGLLEVDDLDGDDLLGPIVEAFVDLSEGSLPDPLLLREDQLRIDPLKRKSKHWSRLMPEAFRSTPDFLGTFKPCLGHGYFLLQLSGCMRETCMLLAMGIGDPSKSH